jgi:hypothetical protein
VVARALRLSASWRFGAEQAMAAVEGLVERVVEIAR